jgi:hypothetical protein
MSTNAAPVGSLSIFGKEESLVLGLPLLFIAASIAELIFFPYLFSVRNLYYTRILADVVSSYHVVLIFPMLLFVPVMRKFREAYATEHRRNFWTIPGLVFAGYFVFFFVFYRFLLSPNHIISGNGAGVLKLLFTFLITALPVQHSVSQYLGFSLAYNNSLKREGLPISEKDRIEKSEKRERKLFNLFLIASILLSLCARLQYFFPELQVHVDKYLHLIIGSVVLLAGLLIYKAAKILPPGQSESGRNHKFLYSLRLLLVPLSGVSLIGYFTSIQVHAIEYSVLCKNINRNDKSLDNRNRYKNIMLVVTLVMALALLPKGILATSGLALVAESIVAQLFMALMMAFSFTHYFLDASVFRMRKKINRTHIGPLLFN